MAVLKQHMLTKMLSPSPSHIIALLFYFEKKNKRREINGDHVNKF